MTEIKKLSLDSPGIGKQIATRLLDDIDNGYCQKAYDDGHRNHLGASLIGHECSRYLWYVFRWCFHKKFLGRVLRLFNRGHREEERFIEFLEGIGCEIWFEDRDANPLYFVAETGEYFLKSNIPTNANYEALAEPILKTNEHYAAHIARAKAKGIKFNQYRISDVMGHFGGSLDGIIKLPPHYGIDEPLLAEFKTNGTGSGFNKLVSQGMQIAKPQHSAQTATYGYKYNFRYCLYMNVCKNDDDMHVEIVKLDHKLGQQMIAKAERIITSQKAPARLSDNATFFACKGCDFNEICHKGALPEKNCRSCVNAVPVENAAWKCEKHNGLIPSYVIKEGCDHYKAITLNV